MVTSVLRGPGSGVLWPSVSARLSPNRDGPAAAPAPSAGLEEMSMEISVRRDTGSALGPGSSTLRRAALGDRWLRESTWRAGSEFLTPRSWNFWVELAREARSRGVWTLRGGVGLGVSTSSTSKDLFKAERQRGEGVMS